jgi:hypothetical protein
LIDKACYRVSGNFPNNKQFKDLKNSPATVTSMCYDEKTAKIARLNDANVNPIKNTNAFVLSSNSRFNMPNYLYVDNMLATGTNIYRSSDGLFDLSKNNWNTGTQTPGSCLTIQNKAVLSHTCDHGSTYGHPILCEYSLL